MARPGRLREEAIRRGRARADVRRASRNRRFRREPIDTDQRIGFRASVDQTPVLSEAVRTVENIGKKYLPSSIDETPILGEIVRTGKNLGQKYLPGLSGGIQRGLGSLTNNLAQNEENERILGDLYTDELRKTMVPNWDVSRGDPGYEGSRREYHDKYKRLAEGTDDADKKQYYLDQARSAYRNANVTKRVNYALGDLGFDTSAKAGKAAFGETPTEFKGRIDYSTLPGKLQSGLEGTDAGQSFIRKHVTPKEGDTDPILQAIKDFQRSGVDLNTRIPPTEIVPEGPLDKIIGWDTDISDAQDLVGTLGTGAEDPTVFRQRQEGLDWDISPEEQELLMSVYRDPELKALQKGPAFAYDETDENVNNWADYTLYHQDPSWWRRDEEYDRGYWNPTTSDYQVEEVPRDPWRTSGPEEVEDWLGTVGPAIDEYAEYGYDPFNSKIIPL